MVFFITALGYEGFNLVYIKQNSIFLLASLLHNTSCLPLVKECLTKKMHKQVLQNIIIIEVMFIIKSMNKKERENRFLL